MENNQKSKKSVNWSSVGSVIVAVIGALSQSGGIIKKS